jgi:hypothetical protein
MPDSSVQLDQLKQMLAAVLQNKQIMTLLNTLRQNGQKQNFAAQNAPYVQPGANNFNTALDPAQELAFRAWVAENKVPFDPEAKQSDYDMRGFWAALQRDDPKAKSAVDPNDKQLHYPDYWKTPSHETFSNESQWATPMAPRWNEQDQLIAPSGRITFHDRRR